MAKKRELVSRCSTNRLSKSLALLWWWKMQYNWYNGTMENIAFPSVTSSNPTCVSMYSVRVAVEENRNVCEMELIVSAKLHCFSFAWATLMCKNIVFVWFPVMCWFLLIPKPRCCGAVSVPSFPKAMMRQNVQIAIDEYL